MILNIQQTDTFENTQTQFASFFPNLKIVFYDAKHIAGQGSTKEHELENTTAWNSFITEDLKFVFTGEISVSAFEQLVATETGVAVQVFRKSKNAWLQTIATDQWSLDEQQAKSVEMDSPIDEQEELEDYHEQK